MAPVEPGHRAKGFYDAIQAVPPGSTLDFEIKIFARDLIPYVQMWLQYGVLRGLGQWRNSGKGRFSVIET